MLVDGVGAAKALPGLRGLLRTVCTPEFAGAVFHEVEAKSALNRVPGTSPLPFRWTVNPYRGCSHACVYCLAGTTRVLLADGRTRAISDLRVGDAVVGTEWVDGRRRYARTTVLAHWSTSKPAHRVRLAGGTELVASGEHRFLTEQGWRHVSGGWCRSGRRPRLRAGRHRAAGNRAGSILVGPGPFVPAREHTSAYRRGYLCGLVRGDGRPAEPSAEQAQWSEQGQWGEQAQWSEQGQWGEQGQWSSGVGAAAPAAGPVPDRAFPSEHLELEALGRAHHFLALAARSSLRAPRAAAVGGAGSAEPGRIPPPDPAGSSIAPIADAVRWPECPDDDWCAGFLGGLVDARGKRSGGALWVSLVDEEILGRAAGALHRLGFGFAVERLGSERSVRVLGGAARQLRLLQVIDSAVGRLRDVGGMPVEGGGALEVVSVEPLGVDLPMYDITTGTGDFVAEGVVSHNCFARNTHTYLDLDAGADFDSQIVVKVNIARVLDRELRSARWEREPVAMGTNTDPYQRAEGRYRLMPAVIGALARSGTPFSLLTKGTVLVRDLPEIVAAAADVPVGLGVSIALIDRDLQARLEPGTPSPSARLDLVRRITDAGLSCGVMVAPVLPMLTDSTEALDALLARIAAAGATGASVLALHLRPGTREWFLAWLAREYPRLVAPYARLYRRGTHVDPDYRRALGERVAPLLRNHGLSGAVTTLRGTAGPVGPAAPITASSGEQLSLL